MAVTQMLGDGFVWIENMLEIVVLSLNLLRNILKWDQSNTDPFLLSPLLTIT